MLISLLVYLLLGLVLAWPLWRLLQWVGRLSGLYTPQWKYLRPYVAARGLPDPNPVRPDAPAAAPQAKAPP